MLNMNKEMNDNVLAIIGERVKELRKSKFKNYVVFAKEIGMSNKTLYNIENGKDFNMSSLIRIIVELDGSFETIFRDIDIDFNLGVVWE